MNRERGHSVQSPLSRWSSEQIVLQPTILHLAPSKAIEPMKIVQCAAAFRSLNKCRNEATYEIHALCCLRNKIQVLDLYYMHVHVAELMTIEHVAVFQAQRSYTITNLTAGARYVVKLQALSSIGGGAITAVDIKTPNVTIALNPYPGEMDSILKRFSSYKDTQSESQFLQKHENTHFFFFIILIRFHSIHTCTCNSSVVKYIQLECNEL